MGADLVLYVCACPSNLGLDTLGGIARIKEYVKDLSVAELDAYFDNYKGCCTLDQAYEEEFGEDPTLVEELAAGHEEPEPEPRPYRLAWGREIIEEDLLDAHKRVFEDGSRETSTLTLEGLDFEISGGMTGGDEPTDAGPLLTKLDFTGIFDLPVRKGMLDLSTGHIPLEKLERHVEDLDVGQRCQAHEHGWIVFIDGDADNIDIPEWFQPIHKLAKASGCMLVNFDKDADQTDLLPWYGEDI